jgi:CDP-6-deoxy-D-xylo-4-hexulose-3-dehydrase
MRTEEEIREEIFSRVAEIYQLRKSYGRFIPGESRISYAGRCVR